MKAFDKVKAEVGEIDILVEQRRTSGAMAVFRKMTHDD